MRVKLLLLMLLVRPALAQEVPEKELQTKINNVTVFMNAAQIFRTGSVFLSPGESIIKVKNLSRYIDAKSTQVNVDGEVIILGVNYSIRYSEKKKNKSRDSLKSLIQIYDENIVQNEALIEAYRAKQQMIDKNNKFGKDSGPIPVSQLKQTFDFYESEYRQIKLKQSELLRENQKLKNQITDLTAEIDKVRKEESESSGELTIKVKNPLSGIAIFSISYVVYGASWYPKYDIRVESIDKPVSLTYKAEISQNTGEDWKNVKLTFSNANPVQRGEMPKLSTWYLNYPRYTNTAEKITQYGKLFDGTINGQVVSSEDGEGIPGVNVTLRGTTFGTITDVDGNYSLTLPYSEGQYLVFSFVGMKTIEVPIKGTEINIQMESDFQELGEVVVTALGITKEKASLGYGVTTIGGSTFGYNSNSRNYSTPASRSLRQGTLNIEMVENQTNFEFVINEPYSIRSGDDKIMIEMKVIALPAIYQYYATPKLEKDAFLVARIADWDKYKLLEGESNLFFEDSYVGRSVLRASTFADTLDISLGRDKNIMVARTLEDQYSKRKVLGLNKIESRGYKITIRNKKSSEINLTILDQIPVSAHSEISVNAVEITSGNLDDETGFITWDLIIPAQSQHELLLHYEVKCPRGEKVVL